MGCYMAVTQTFSGRPCVFIKTELKSFQTVHTIMLSPASILPYYFVLDLTHTLVYLSVCLLQIFQIEPSQSYNPC